MRAGRFLPLATASVAGLTLALLAPDPAGAAARPDRAAVPNAQPRMAASAVGAPAASQRLQVTVHLALRNSGELGARVRAVSDPASAQYGHYLTPAQFRARYAPSTATVDALRRYLAGYGLSVTDVPANNTYVTAGGTVAQAEAAFSTKLATYQVNGHAVRAATSKITLPSALAGQVTAVSGLASVSSLTAPRHVDGPTLAPATTTAARRVAPSTATPSAPPPPAFVNAPPCSTYFGQKIATSLPSAFGAKQPYATCGYTPSQLQSAYGLNASITHGLDGSGVTVAITDAYAAPTIVSDANTYAVLHDQAPLHRGQFRQVLPSGFTLGYDANDECGEQGWYGEETLDVEAVHAVAPGAHITYVAAASCDNGDFATALNKIVDRHLADIVTNSWGSLGESNGSPELDAVYQQVFYQGALEGIGFYFSSGDDGDEALNNGTPTIDAPANSNLVTAVGGTTLAVGRQGGRTWETGWSTGRSVLSGNSWDPAPPGDFWYGAGGGTSQVFAQPWYQRGVVPASLSKLYSSTPARVIPDVSALADPNTGMLIGETQTFPNGSEQYSEYRIGGTSLSSPLFAGMMAIADQVAGHPHGFANPALYALYGSRSLYDPKPMANRAVVRVDFANGVDAADGLNTSLRSIDSPAQTTLRTRTGYDDITGIGSPNGSAFIAGLARR